MCVRVRLGRTATHAAELTAAENRVLHLLFQGCSDARIAAELWVSVKAVRYYIDAIHQKLDPLSLGENDRWIARLAFAAGEEMAVAPKV